MNAPQLNNENLLTPDEAAKYLGLGKHQLKLWRCNRNKGEGEQGPAFVRISHKSVRYMREDLVAFAESKKPVAGDA